jgi:hypothetical protein
MSGQHDPGHLRRTDGGEQVGFGAGVVEYQIRDDAQPVEVVAHELDQGEIGVAARRIEPDQSLEHLVPVQRGCLPHVIPRRLLGTPRQDYRIVARACHACRWRKNARSRRRQPTCSGGEFASYSVPRLGEGPASRRSIDRCSALPSDEASADGEPRLP